MKIIYRIKINIAIISIISSLKFLLFTKLFNKITTKTNEYTKITNLCSSLAKKELAINKTINANEYI